MVPKIKFLRSKPVLGRSGHWGRPLRAGPRQAWEGLKVFSKGLWYGPYNLIYICIHIRINTMYQKGEIEGPIRKPLGQDIIYTNITTSRRHHQTSINSRAHVKGCVECASGFVLQGRQKNTNDHEDPTKSMVSESCLSWVTRM